VKVAEARAVIPSSSRPTVNPRTKGRTRCSASGSQPGSIQECYVLVARLLCGARRRGLPFEGMGTALAVFVAVGGSVLLWLCAAVVYLVSIVKGAATRPAPRLLDVSLLLVVLLALAAAFAVYGCSGSVSRTPFLR